MHAHTRIHIHIVPLMLLSIFHLQICCSYNSILKIRFILNHTIEHIMVGQQVLLVRMFLCRFFFSSRINFNKFLLLSKQLLCFSLNIFIFICVFRHQFEIFRDQESGRDSANRCVVLHVLQFFSLKFKSKAFNMLSFITKLFEGNRNEFRRGMWIWFCCKFL